MTAESEERMAAMAAELRALSIDGSAQRHPLLAHVQRKVKLFFERHDDDQIKRSFERHKDAATGLILRQSFEPALRAFGVVLTRAEADTLFLTLDLDNNCGLDLEEYKRALGVPTGLEQWARTLPLAELLAASMPVGDNTEDALRDVGCFGAAELDVATAGFSEGLQRILVEQRESLKRSFEELDRKAMARNAGSSAKFATFKLSYGTTEDFHKGLQERIGGLLLVNAVGGFLDEWMNHVWQESRIPKSTRPFNWSIASSTGATLTSQPITTT